VSASRPVAASETADSPAIAALRKRIRGEFLTTEEHALLDAARKPTPERQRSRTKQSC
jgi:hypothetical protein